MQIKPASPKNPDPFMKGPPGWSLTQPPGKWPWETPPQYTNPDEVVELIIDRLDEEETQERYKKLMLAGVSIEEITKSITMAGFMQGKYSPDVAEIIKGPVAIYLMKIADDNDLPVKVYAKDPRADEKSDLDDMTILDIMKARNPDMYDYVTTYEPEEVAAERFIEDRADRGFLAVEEEDEEIKE